MLAKLDVQLAIAAIGVIAGVLNGVIAIILNRQKRELQKQKDDAELEKQEAKARAQKASQEADERIKGLEARAEEARREDDFRVQQLQLFREFASDIKSFTVATMKLNESIVDGNKKRDDLLRAITENQDAHTVKLDNQTRIVSETYSAVDVVHDAVKQSAKKLDELPPKFDDLRQGVKADFTTSITTITDALKDIERAIGKVQGALSEQHSAENQKRENQTHAINTLGRQIHEVIQKLETAMIPIIEPDLTVNTEPEKEPTPDGSTTQ